MSMNEMLLAERLLGHAEHGDSTIVTKVLNGLSPEERLTVAREMDKLNEAHRKSIPNLPDITLVTVNNTNGDESLVDMKVKGKTGSGKQTSVDIYDMPASETAKLDSDPSSIDNGEYSKAVEALTKLESTQEQAERDAARITETLLRKGNFGNNLDRITIEKLLEQYAEKSMEERKPGQEAFQQLVEVINKKLEEKNSELRVKGNYDLGNVSCETVSPDVKTIFPSASLSLRKNGSSEIMDKVKGSVSMEIEED